MLEYFFSVLGWWFMSMVKFVLTPFMMMYNREWGMGQEHWSYFEVIGITSSGAAMWAFIFFKFGDFIFNWFAHHLKRPKKIFTRRNRWVIRVKRKWGLRGMLVISGLVSVPIASMLTAKLYRHNKTALPKLIIAFFVWSVMLTTIAFGAKQIGMRL